MQAAFAGSDISIYTAKVCQNRDRDKCHLIQLEGQSNKKFISCYISYLIQLYAHEKMSAVL